MEPILELLPGSLYVKLIMMQKRLRVRLLSRITARKERG